MGITWIPPAPTPGVSGTAGCASGSVFNGEWLSCNKGEPIYGEIASTHDSGVSCAVTHVCAPAPPPGLTITDTATGIKVSGQVDAVLTTQINTDYSLTQNDQPNKVNQPTKPANSMLTHFTPLAQVVIVYTITVNAAWTHMVGPVPVVTLYTLDWKVALYNTWVSEKQQIIALA